MEKNDILIANEVADLIRSKTDRVYQLVREKKIPFILIGQRQYRFSKKAIEAWLDNGGNSKKEDNENV